MANIQKADTPVNALQRIMEANEKSIRQAIAGNMDPKRLMRIAVSAMNRNAALQNCSMPSIINSVMLCGITGLEPNTPLQHAYLIPYGKECTFQPGYRGLMHMAHQSAGVSKFAPQLVYEGDVIEEEYGMDEKFRHIPKHESDEWIGAYSFVRYQDGTFGWQYMPKHKILEIRDRFSKAWSMKGKDSPWGTSEDEMVIKTVIKRHIKRMNLSVEIATAARADDQADTDMKQENFLEVEFKQIAEQAEEADFNLQGSREKQEDMAQQKVAELKGEPNYNVAQQERKETPEEEMARLTREAVEREAGESNRNAPIDSAGPPARKAALQFGKRGDK